MTKVLIIEDDPLMSRLYRRALTFEGYQVSVAADGKEGLKKARSERPALILLDVMMPVMNGLQVLKKLQSDPLTDPIPVILLTNMVNSRSFKAGRPKGAARHLIKSECDPKQIADAVKAVLAR